MNDGMTKGIVLAGAFGLTYILGKIKGVREERKRMKDLLEVTIKTNEAWIKNAGKCEEENDE